MAVLIAVTTLLTVCDALAEIRVSAFAIPSPFVPSRDGWMECVVRIENVGTSVERGFVEVSSNASMASDDALMVRAPYAVAGEATINVQLPIRVSSSIGVPLNAVLTNEAGHRTAATTVDVADLAAPLLVDAAEPPRLAGVLRNATVGLDFALSPEHVYGRSHARTGVVESVIETSGVRRETATGDPVLPERAAGYAGTTVVVMRSDQLLRLPANQLEALANYVLAGGTLALVVVRVEDLRTDTVVSFVGPDVIQGPIQRILRRLAGKSVVKKREAYSPAEDADGGVVFPGEAIRNGLVGFGGGNTRPTMFGGSASYGLGEVHLLPIDPTQGPGLEDAWVQARMRDLVVHAWNRRKFLAAQHGVLPPSGINDVVEVLDPNRSTGWTIAVAAMVLVVYAVIAGPVNFSLAARRQRPMRALWVLPVLSLGTFLLLVVLGIAAKGPLGEARHLTLIDAGAGMSKAPAFRYRGFYTPNSRQLTVRATDPSGVVDASTKPRAGAVRTLLVDRHGVELRGLSTIPWESVVVREDGFASLGAGLSVVLDLNDELTLTNRTSRNLRGVIAIKPPRRRTGERSVFYFPQILDGESKRTSEAQSLSIRPWIAARVPRRDGLGPVASLLDQSSKGLTEAWLALGSVSPTESDWWPEDVPVVLAQMDGGEGSSTDSGLRIRSDRVLLRVVGFGGER